MKTNDYLITYAKAQLGKPYWYGCFGQTSNPQLLAGKRAQYPQFYRDSDFEKQMGFRVHDCAGLVKGALWSDTPEAQPVYKKTEDFSAAGLYSKATKKGTIGTFDEVPGRLLFKGGSPSKIHHVGVYIGDGKIIEAKGHKWGVVETTFNPKEWSHWCQCHLFEETTVKPEVKPEPSALVPSKTVEQLAREVIKGLWSNGAERKNRLEKAGYNYAEIQAKVDEILKPKTVTTVIKKPTETVYKVTAKSGLNVRSGPSVSFRKITCLPLGTRVRISDQTNGWGKLKGRTGWVSMTYLKPE